MTKAQLDPSLKQVIAIGTPVELVDPVTNEVFYLVSAEQFRLLASGSSVDDDPQLSYPLVDLVMAADDSIDPLLDSYQ